MHCSSTSVFLLRTTLYHDMQLDISKGAAQDLLGWTVLECTGEQVMGESDAN